MYRNDELALYHHLELLRGKLLAANKQCQRLEAEEASLLEHLESVEHEHNESQSFSDRTAAAALTMVIIGAVVAPIHWGWHDFIRSDPTVIPAILGLALPAVIGIAIAWPSRRVSRGCRIAAYAGALLCLAPIISLCIALAPPW